MLSKLGCGGEWGIIPLYCIHYLDLPGSQLLSNHQDHARAHQGLVPDFLVTFPAQHGQLGPASSQLVELKCISAGSLGTKHM